MSYASSVEVVLVGVTAAHRLDPPLRIPLLRAWRGPPSPALRRLLDRIGAEREV